MSAELAYRLVMNASIHAARLTWKCWAALTRMSVCGGGRIIDILNFSFHITHSYLVSLSLPKCIYFDGVQ